MNFLKEYTLLKMLGNNAFSSVYKVSHNELGCIRAIRVMNDIIVDASSKAYQIFLRECNVLLRLNKGNHPNIVHVYQPRLIDDKAILEMDYVDGVNIYQYLQQEQNFVPVEEVIRLATQMSSALAYCHEDIYRFCMDRDLDNLQYDPNDSSKVLMDDTTRNRLIKKYKVIVNDIHSANILRDKDGKYVMLDFSIAISDNEVVRSSCHVNGLPEFKAPEKWNNDFVVTEQSDIYSLGIVLYQYLAGRVPFPYGSGDNWVEMEMRMCNAHKESEPPAIEPIRRAFFEKKYEGKVYERDYPLWLEEAIMKCLNKKPEDRFKNGKELFEFIRNNLGIRE